MQEAGARSLRADEQPNISAPDPGDREAVLLAWERKIEQEERRSGARRLTSDEQADRAPAQNSSTADQPRRAARPETEAEPRRFEGEAPRRSEGEAPRRFARAETAASEPAAPRRRTRQPRFERHGAPAPRIAPARESAPEAPRRPAAPVDEPPPLRPAAPSAPRGAGMRRTVTITGQPVPARRRASVMERHLAVQPDRIALWAFLLGLFLVAVAAGTAQAG